MGHIRKECPSLHTETRTCFVCHSRGHIARDCPKATNPNHTVSKRRQPIPVDSHYEAPVTILCPPPVETMLLSASPTFSITALHEAPATSFEVISAPTPKHQSAAPMHSAGSSVNPVSVPIPLKKNVAIQSILDHTVPTEILSDIDMDDSDSESTVSSMPSIKTSAAKIAKNKNSNNPTRKSSHLTKGQTGKKFHDSKYSTLGTSAATITLLGHGTKDDADTVSSSPSH